MDRHAPRNISSKKLADIGSVIGDTILNYIERMKQTVEDEEWTTLVQIAKEAIIRDKSPDVALFFLSVACRNLGRFQEAITTAAEGIHKSPASQWGVSVYYEACKAAGCVEMGLDVLNRFLVDYPECSSVRRLLVDQAAEFGNFELATRLFVDGPDEKCIAISSTKSIVVQCFAKPDTLERAIKHLLNCEGRNEWNIVIFQDSIEGNSRREQYEKHYNNTKSILNGFASELSKEFSSVAFLSVGQNIGTTAGCRKALDFAFKYNDYAVFLEDDCDFDPSTLMWFDYARSLLSDDIWFAAGESIFFNPAHRQLSEADRSRLFAIADKHSLGSQFTEVKFVPSSCFATLRTIWDKVRLVRGLPRGDENLSAFLVLNEARTAMPMVPLVFDRGMLHDQGYSVVTLGKDNVREIKNHLSVGTEFNKNVARSYAGDLGLMHRATCLLDQNAITKLLSQV